MPAEGRQFLGFSLYLKRMWFQIQILKPLSPNLKDPLPWVTLHWKFKGGIKKKKKKIIKPESVLLKILPITKLMIILLTLTMKALQAIALFEECLRLFAASAKSDYLQPGLNSLVTQPDLLFF